MVWYINRGEDMIREQRIVFEFFRSLPLDFATSRLIFYDELIECSQDKAPDYPRAGVTVPNCTLKADLTGVDRKLFRQKTGINGEEYFEVHYKLVVETKTALMRFFLEFNGKEIGSIEAKYS